MKHFQHFLAAALALAILLSCCLTSFAAQADAQRDVEMVSITCCTPYSVETVQVEKGCFYRLPDGEDQSNAQHLFWVTEECELTDSYNPPATRYKPGSLIAPTEDMTLYAYYAVGQWTNYDKWNYFYEADAPKDGVWAICGWDVSGDDYVFTNPAILTADGGTCHASDISDLQIGFEFPEFFTNAQNICFLITHWPNGCKLIQSLETEQYVSVKDGKLAMVDEPDENAYWNFVVDEDRWYARNNLLWNRVFLYDYHEKAFVVAKDDEPLAWMLEETGNKMRPSQVYSLAMYRASATYMNASSYGTKLKMPCCFAQFTDCPYSWYHEPIDYVFAFGLMNGVSATAFEPNETMTRAMMVTVLYRMEGEPEVSGPSGFTDVPSGQWYSDAIAWAKEMQVVNGVGNGKFEPESPVTREQIATILWRYLGEQEADVDLSVFHDAGKIDPYARKAMQWAVAKGLFIGDAGNLKPLVSATRAEFATIVMRFLGGRYLCDK